MYFVQCFPQHISQVYTNKNTCHYVIPIIQYMLDKDMCLNPIFIYDMALEWRDNNLVLACKIVVNKSQG